MNNVHKKWFEAEENLKSTVYSSTSSKIKVVQAIGRINRASLEESTQRALTVSQDVKIPDGPIVIDKDLLKEIRDAFDNEASDGNTYCKELRDKLDSLYPFLMNISADNPPARLNSEEAIKFMDSLDDPKCYACDGSGMYQETMPNLFIETKICLACEGTGQVKPNK